MKKMFYFILLLASRFSVAETVPFATCKTQDAQVSISADLSNLPEFSFSVDIRGDRRAAFYCFDSAETRNPWSGRVYAKETTFSFPDSQEYLEASVHVDVDAVKQKRQNFQIRRLWSLAKHLNIYGVSSPSEVDNFSPADTHRFYEHHLFINFREGTGSFRSTSRHDNGNGGLNFSNICYKLETCKKTER